MNRMKNDIISILRYVESSQGFPETKQVSAPSIQVCRGPVAVKDVPCETTSWNSLISGLTLSVIH